MKNMKKVLCLIITIALVLSSTSIAFAQSDHNEERDEHQTTEDHRSEKHHHSFKAKKQSFKINGSPVIKYGRYKLPISPITKGMGATVTFDKATAVLTVVKDSTTIVIDFKNKTVTVNGAADTESGIFTVNNSNKMTVLIKYIAEVLGVRAYCDDDKVIVEVPGLDYPTNVKVTPVGAIVKSNTLNSTTLLMTAAADIKAGQATGGKAELYVGSKLVATDAAIAAEDTTVTFTTDDGTPTNAELMAAVPEGGVVTVKLYNAAGQFVVSNKSNPKLIVDYTAPMIAGITSATYNSEAGKLYLNVTGAGAVGDRVDVTRISVWDTTLGKTYQLTNTAETGSVGSVMSENVLEIKVGSTDKIGLAGFGGTTTFLGVAAGPLLTDAAGNGSVNFTAVQTVPLTVAAALDLPVHITVTPVGAIMKENTLNGTTLYMTASASITAGQATGGRAELYVGSKLVATDAVITATDTTVTFMTADDTPTNAELMALIPAGGEVSVKLYNANNYSVTSAKASNPILVVDYTAPAIAAITSAIYNVAGGNLYLNVTGAGTAGDKVDVTKLSLFDTTLGKTYQLTNDYRTGSSGIVINDNIIVITLGSADKSGISGYGGSTAFLNIATGAFLSDIAGNVSANFTAALSVPVTVIK